MSPLLVATALGAAAAAAAATDPESHASSIIEWVRSNGGTVSPKIKFRRSDPGDPASPFGAFAADDIQEEELLLRIPPDCLITGDPPAVGDAVQANYMAEGEWFGGWVTAVNDDGTYDVEYDDGDAESNIPPTDVYKEFEGAVACDTLKNLIREMRLGDESEYAPFVRYMLDQRPGQLPMAWSLAGKKLMMDILGGDLPPKGAINRSHHIYCETDRDEFENNVAMLQVQRAWDDVMIPVSDMINHRNGRWLNIEEEPVMWNQDVVVRASRDIVVGEQIYTSYNLCANCGNRAFGYGTPEILRDYGFVEQYPQRWFFPEYMVAFELEEPEAGSGDLRLTWLKEGKPYSIAVVDILREHLARLKDLAETKFKSPEGVAPENEWAVARQYCEALIDALSSAIKAATIDVDPDCLLSENGECVAFSADLEFDALEEETDNLEYGRGLDKAFVNYFNLEELETPYQTIFFFQDPENMDTCMQLDGIVQTCQSYRPHYHDIAIHFTARFLNSVRRVLFVGGGDSMLLNEIIKYPSLELVVGLELDQTVTRKCFKHFGTQPHWDDPRVQWWFGDAAKSLLMLPKDYFGSFDLVIVDLSETVMSISVSNELDIMGALALLLKPDGILVKNELYFDQLSELFDNTVQVHVYDVPFIFSQCFSYGSNSIDFLTQPRKDHDVEILWPAHFDTPEHFEEAIHSYHRNDGRPRNFCKKHDEVDESDEQNEQVKSPGILMIVEAEGASTALGSAEEVTETLKKSLEEENLAVISTIASPLNEDGVTVVIVLSEGYVVARTWPEHRYCAFDIHLWSSFEKHDSVKKALIAAVGSGSSSSSYRIVAGGMFGVSTWKQDEKNRGPRFTQPCDRPAQPQRQAQLDRSIVDIVLEESMALSREGGVVAAVICGRLTQPCESLGVLEKNDHVREVIALRTCPSVEDGDEDGKEYAMFGCEKEVLTTLKESMSGVKKLGAIIMDPSAPIEMGQIVQKIFSSQGRKEQMLEENLVVLAPMLDVTETWRRSFVDRFRRDIIVEEPVFRAAVLFNSTEGTMEMGITSSGDPNFTQHLLDVTTSIEERSGIVSDVRDIQRGLFKWIEHFEPTNFFLPDSWDRTSSLEQWSSQRPLGHQTVFQLEINTNVVVGDKVHVNFQGEGEWIVASVVSVNPDDTFDVTYDDGKNETGVKPEYLHKALEDPEVCDAVRNLIQDKGSSYSDHILTTEQVKRALGVALSSMESESISTAEVHEFSSIGDGCVLVALWSGGSVVVLWDGRTHVDINLFMNVEGREDPDKLMNHFMEQIPLLETVLRDEQPRGHGRVVNFLKDIEPRGAPHWAYDM